MYFAYMTAQTVIQLEENQEQEIRTQPNANGRLFPVPKGTVAIGGE